MNTSEDKIKMLFLCFLLFAVILYLRTGIVYPASFIEKIISILSLTEDTLKIFGLSAFVEILKEYEPWQLLFAFSSLQIIISSLIVFIFTNKLNFAYKAEKKDCISIIKHGTICFFAIIIIVFSLAFSVIGLPIAFLLLLFFHIAIFLGSIPLSVFVGKHILEHHDFSLKSSVFNYLFGSFLLLLLGSMYYIGYTFVFFILPCLSLGIFINIMIKYKRYGKYYFKKKEEKDSFDREYFRNLIRGNK